ncbi:sigma 54-interacting transcriptional regulator [Salinisphaera aquimarina]|uniref:Sigma 54-interacting transcriptional regulator n=1 Tax=Salinisphaera aquimarina TaxID=2094031 RepID=A0ABV7EQ97_9GAMM
MFGGEKHNRSDNSVAGESRVAVHVELRLAQNQALQQRIADGIAPQIAQILPDRFSQAPAVDAVFALFPEIATLERLAADVRAQRAQRSDGLPVLVVGLSPDRLTEFGGWLADAAREDNVHGLRLIVDRDPDAIIARLPGYLEPVVEPNIIAMPISTEVETAEHKYFFCLSPQLRGLLAYLAELAANNISRIYLLGGPGAGKTSLAYYYYLCRERGNFVTVNLSSEATDDKAAMKSLLCGHVSGAFAGAGSRTGAFSHARDGVCFLDESHGVSGSVMEVLMEALDSNQYLPYGASAKRPLDCALVFASNRNWDTLIASVNMDEHARLGAQILHLPDLAVRQEDLVAVLAATLNNMRRRSTTWIAPAGLSHAAWQAVRSCDWRGNTRALIRVIETAFVTAATDRAPLIERDAIDDALALWEPDSHASHALYTVAGR